MNVPVFVNCRDRVTSLAKLVAWLERAGSQCIILIDNASTYAPLLDYYARTPHCVVRLGRNAGHTSLWSAGVLERHYPSGRYVYTDPDVVPCEDCPLDAIQQLSAALDRHPNLHKVGLSLRIDDLPDAYRHKQDVVDWEGQFWKKRLETKLFLAPVDTTFALYRGRDHDLMKAARTDRPYSARHEAWYVDSTRLTDEERYYRRHARQTSWNVDAIAPGLRAEIDRVRARR